MTGSVRVTEPHQDMTGSVRVTEPHRNLAEKSRESSLVVAWLEMCHGPDARVRANIIIELWPQETKAHVMMTGHVTALGQHKQYHKIWACDLLSLLVYDMEACIMARERISLSVSVHVCVIIFVFIDVCTRIISQVFRENNGQTKILQESEEVITAGSTRKTHT
jgi:hypothetical protein